MHTTIEHQAIRETIKAIEDFKKAYGLAATQDAIANGAFHNHKEYGELASIFIYNDIDEDVITIPKWISNIFIEYATS